MKKKRSIIPNIFTMSNMLMGFFAIMFAGKGDPESMAIAGILIFIGALFDVSDGAIARALNVESPIGLQLDSLADGVSYGIAPGILSYYAYLKNLPEIIPGVSLGIIVAAVFPVCAIYRLAKFNCLEDHKGFTGLPSPAAGIVISALPALPLSDLPFIGAVPFHVPVEVFIPFFIIIALLMVSTLDYTKLFSDIYHKGAVPAIVTLIAIILLLVFFRMWSVFVIAALYILSGLVRYLFHLAKGKQ